MESMPCGTFAANEAYFAIGVLSYNLFIGFKSLNPFFSNHTIKTFRWSFFNIAGKIIKHSGNINFVSYIIVFRRRLGTLILLCQFETDPLLAVKFKILRFSPGIYSVRKIP